MPPNPGRGHRATVPQNGSHITQDLVMAEWGVIEAKRIPTSDDTIAMFPDQPVRDKRLVAVAQDNPAGAQFGCASPPHGQDVARPDRGEHAGSGDSQTDFSKSANDLRGEVAFGCILQLSG